MIQSFFSSSYDKSFSKIPNVKERFQSASFPISFSIGYTGPSLTKGKEIMSSHNTLQQEHLKQRFIRPFTETNDKHDWQLFSYNHSYWWSIPTNMSGQECEREQTLSMWLLGRWAFISFPYQIPSSVRKWYFHGIIHIYKASMKKTGKSTGKSI
jgi:hypothetical protein